MKSITRKGKLAGASRSSQPNVTTTSSKKEIEERRLRKLKVYLRSVTYNGCEGLPDFPSLTDLYQDTILSNEFPCDTMNQSRRYSYAPTAFLVACCFNRRFPAITRRRTGNIRPHTSVKRNLKKTFRETEVVSETGNLFTSKSNDVTTKKQDGAKATGKPSDKIIPSKSSAKVLDNDHGKNVPSETTNNHGQTRVYSVTIKETSANGVKSAEETSNSGSKDTGLKRSESLTEIPIFQLDKTGFGQTDLEIRENTVRHAEKFELPKLGTSDIKQVGGSIKTEISTAVVTESSLSRHTHVESNLVKRFIDSHLNIPLKLESVVTADTMEKDSERCNSADKKDQIVANTNEKDEETLTESTRHMTQLKTESYTNVQRDDKDTLKCQVMAMANKHIDQTGISSGNQFSNSLSDKTTAEIQDSHVTNSQRRSSRVASITPSTGVNNEMSFTQQRKGGKEKNMEHRNDGGCIEKNCPKKTIQCANISLRNRAIIKQPASHHKLNVKKGKQL